MRRPVRRLVHASALLAILAPAAGPLTQGGSPTNAFDPAEEDVCIGAPPMPYDPKSALPMLAPRPVHAGARDT